MLQASELFIRKQTSSIVEEIKNEDPMYNSLP